MKVERGAGGVEVAEVAGAAKRRRMAPPGVRRNAGGGVARRARRRRVQADAAAVQRLFQACRAVFRGPGTVPAPAEVHLLCDMIGASPLLSSPSTTATNLLPHVTCPHVRVVATRRKIRPVRFC